MYSYFIYTKEGVTLKGYDKSLPIKEITTPIVFNVGDILIIDDTYKCKIINKEYYIWEDFDENNNEKSFVDINITIDIIEQY